MTISLGSWEDAAIGLAGLAAAGILSPSSARIARWALPFPPCEVGSLHSGSPAQCPRAPRRMHLDLALSDFNFSYAALGSSGYALPCPFLYPYLCWTCLHLYLLSSQRLCAATCNCTACPASEDSSSSSRQFRAIASDSDNS